VRDGYPSVTDGSAAAQAVERAIDLLRDAAKEKKTGIVASGPKGDGRFDLDPVRFERVVASLLGDALDGARPGGQILVKLAWQPRHFELRILDGDSAARAPDAQADSGPGLSVARRIVESFGGSVDAPAEGGAAAAPLIVRLPRLPLDASNADAPAGAATSLPLAGVRALYVDDEADVAEPIRIALESMGAVVSLCASFEAAADSLNTGCFDVVLTDLSLEDGSTGFDVIELLRSLPQHRSVPAIVVSAYDADDDLGATRDAGFVAHLVKPIDFEELAREVRRSVARARTRSGR
jgi:CheY-like chemotaxis protein